MSLYPGAPYEYTRVANGLIFMAGACPLDDEGQVVAPGNHEAQAARATENLLQALAEHDAGPESVLKTTIYVVGNLAEDQDPATIWFLARGDVVNAWLNDRVAARRLGDSHGQCIPTRRDSALRVVEHA